MAVVSENVRVDLKWNFTSHWLWFSDADVVFVFVVVVVVVGVILLKMLLMVLSSVHKISISLLVLCF